MEIDSLKKQLAGLDRTVLAITELCERRAPTDVHAYLASIQRDVRQLESLLRHEAADSRYMECLAHLKQAGNRLMDSCMQVSHKDSRVALEDLTMVLAALPQPEAMHH